MYDEMYMLNLAKTVILLVQICTSCAKLSKCTQNFLKAREETKNNVADEWHESGDPAFSLASFVAELGGPNSPGLYPENISQLYPNCRHLDGTKFFPESRMLIDFNNGRLGNQVSVASNQ